MEHQFYKENGYAVFKGLLNKEVIDSIKSKILTLLKRFFEQNKDLNNVPCNDLYTGLECLFKHDQKLYGDFIKMTGVISRIPEVIQLQFHSQIIAALNTIGIADFMVPTGPAVHIVSPNMRIDGGYFGVEAHQDWTSMHGSLDSVIIWIPFTNVNSETNPLEIVPKSHLEGVIECQEALNCNIVDKYSDKDFMPVIVEKGDVCFLSSFTVHRTGLHGTPNTLRIAISYRVDNIHDNYYIRKMYPTAYRRIVERSLAPNDIPPITEIRRVFS